MKNLEIKYDLSTDYYRLYELLLKGFKVIGLVKSFIPNNSLIELFFHNPKEKQFEIGQSAFMENITKDFFIQICESKNIRFFDIKEEIKKEFYSGC
jgi:hypothetical protein